MSGARVLFVDDEPNVLDGIRRGMRAYSEAWESVFASDGEEALALMERMPVHVVVTDIAMPVMDGKTLITRLYEAYPEVVVLVLSGHWTRTRAAEQLGPSVRFLSKPAGRDRLAAAILDALGEVMLPALAGRRPASSLASPRPGGAHDPSWLDALDEKI